MSKALAHRLARLEAVANAPRLHAERMARLDALAREILPAVLRDRDVRAVGRDEPLHGGAL